MPAASLGARERTRGVQADDVEIEVEYNSEGEGLEYEEGAADELRVQAYDDDAPALDSGVDDADVGQDDAVTDDDDDDEDDDELDDHAGDDAEANLDGVEQDAEDEEDNDDVDDDDEYGGDAL